MVLLITGASHTGKTVLSQKLLEKYKGSEEHTSELQSHLT